eukprot:3142683-Pyramimonas_sp.AAC.1
MFRPATGGRGNGDPLQSAGPWNRERRTADSSSARATHCGRQRRRLLRVLRRAAPSKVSAKTIL